MKSLRFLSPLFVCAVIAWADTVELKPDGDNPDAPGLKLEGKVVRELSDAIVLAVQNQRFNEERKVVIPRSKIKAIEYDINSERSELEEDDYPGHYRLGKKAIEKGKLHEALKILEGIKGKEGVGQDMLKLLGHAYEQRQKLDKALENYSDYLKLSPDDKEVAAKVEKLKKEVNPEAEAGPEGMTPGVRA